MTCPLSSLKDQLSESEILRIAEKNKIPIQGIYAKDQLPHEPTRTGKYVINMQSSTDGNGTHWVCLDHGRGEYFDSFGMPPPLEVERFVGPQFRFNKTRYQALKSECCGWFCLYFLKPDIMSNLETDPDKLWKNDGIIRSALLNVCKK